MEEKKNTRDFVDYKPDQIKLLTQEEFEIAAKHSTILSALRDNIMTVKEIHDLYQIVEENDKSHSVTQQTIYRYLEELESTELIKVAGFRKTEGIKASERIYGRTAQIFLTIPNTEENEMEKLDEEQSDYIFNVGKIIGIALDLDFDKLQKEEFIKFYQNYILSRAKSVEKLYEKAKTSSDLHSVFSSMSLDQINESMWYLQVFVPFIENQSILTQLVELYQ